MKLHNFYNLGNYNFEFQFANNKVITANLKPLIGNKVKTNQLTTARIDPDWKCLEFNDGMVDIEPTTLYKFCVQLYDYPNK